MTKIRRYISILMLASIILPTLWCCVIPIFTGQACLDFFHANPLDPPNPCSIFSCGFVTLRFTPIIGQVSI